MGNEYLYSRLSSMTGGEYLSLRNNTFISMLDNVTGKISNYLKSLEVFIQTNGGYTFSNYRLKQSGNFFYKSDGLDMIGKYIGEPPFEINVYGQNSADEVFSFSKIIGAEKVIDGGKSIQSAWSASYMQELMGMEQNNQVVGHIINTSISKRILSNYTAFLVLEPGFDIPDVDELNDIDVPGEAGWPEFVNLIEGEASDLSISLSNYPNPFTAHTTISYSLPEYSTITLSVFNAAGQLVEIILDEDQESGEYNIELDASQYERGIYFCTLQVEGAVMAKLKLLVI